MIRKSDIVKTGNTFAYLKIQKACSYYNLLIGLLLLLPLILRDFCLDFAINFIISIPLFIIFYIASYSNIKELVLIVGCYLLVLLMYKFDFSLNGIGILIVIYKMILIIGIIFNSLAVLLEKKCKENNKTIVENDEPQQNKNGKKFRDI